MPSFASAAREFMRDAGSAERSALAPLAPHPHHRAAASAVPARVESVADFLGGVPMFAGLSEPLRDQLAASSRSVRVAAGDWLFREGEDATFLFVVRAGRLEVVAEQPPEALLRVLGRGDALGELALLTSSPRSASVRAARDSDLIAIDREPFERLLDEAPELSRGVARALAAQLRVSRGAAEVARPRPGTVAVLALDRDLPRDGDLIAARGCAVASLRSGDARRRGDAASRRRRPARRLRSAARPR